MISVVVNSLNEGEKLDKCLSSVEGWADEIVVIDMESSDSTQAVAKKYKAKIYSHPKINYVEPSRKFASDKATGNWILILDPDEKLTEDLKRKLKTVSEENFVDAVNIARLNFIGEKKMKHTNFWPDKHIRFFKKGKVEFSNIIHSYPTVNGSVMELPSQENLAIQHYSYSSIEEYWSRMKRYSDVEARNLYQAGKRFNVFTFWYMGFYDFIRRYFRHLGFLDGIVGLQVSILQLVYYLMVQYKLLNLAKK